MINAISCTIREAGRISEKIVDVSIRIDEAVRKLLHLIEDKSEEF